MRQYLKNCVPKYIYLPVLDTPPLNSSIGSFFGLYGRHHIDFALAVAYVDLVRA